MITSGWMQDTAVYEMSEADIPLLRLRVESLPLYPRKLQGPHCNGLEPMPAPIEELQGPLASCTCGMH